MHRFIAIVTMAALTAVAMPQASHAQVVTPHRFDDNILNSDEAVQHEVERIDKLPISRSAYVNQVALEEAKSAADGYRYFSNPDTHPLVSPDEVKTNIRAAMSRLPAALKACATGTGTHDADAIKAEIAQQLQRLASDWSTFANFSDPNTPNPLFDLSGADQATLDESSRVFNGAPESFCQHKPDPAQLTKQLEATIDIETRLNMRQSKAVAERQPRAKTLFAAWDKRRGTLQRWIEDQAPAADTIAQQLGWIIGAFCLFGILMFVSLKAFDQTVQLELVNSGQVIQFATVMVLLIVICVLGMSKIITENTLGTLLGGIGGYVLAQGVGRTARNNALRDRGAPPHS